VWDFFYRDLFTGTFFPITYKNTITLIVLINNVYTIHSNNMSVYYSSISV